MEVCLIVRRFDEIGVPGWNDETIGVFADKDTAISLVADLQSEHGDDEVKFLVQQVEVGVAHYNKTKYVEA